MFLLQIQTRNSSQNTTETIYLLGKQHGFRQAKNIKFSLDGKFYFYSRVFNFEAHDIEVDVSDIIVV